MTGLPDTLRRLPYVFYTLAAVVFVWNLANQWMTISAIGDFSNSLDQVDGYQKSIALYGAVVEAGYMVANGAMLQILIAVFDKLKGTGE